MLNHCEKYNATPDNIKHILNKYGVAIVPQILNENECHCILEKMWDYFEHISQSWDKPIDRNNKETWNGLYELLPKHSMLHQHFGVGHAQACWDVRQSPKVVEIFAEFWGVPAEDLLVSFDGLSFHPPPEITNRGWNRNNTWYHCDQSFTQSEFKCVQSWVTVEDVEDGDATLTFYEGSHKYHNEFESVYQTGEKSDWYKLQPNEEQFYIDKLCKQTRIVCPKGSLVLWDSRTIHCGSESIRGRANPKWRAIIYLCYQPRSYATEAQLNKKKKALIELRTTSHWPAKIKLFSKTPRTYGKELPTITPLMPPKLTKLGKRLAGFTNDE